MAFRPRPVRTACLMQASLMTGNMPGIAASTSETWLLGAPPNSVDAPENSFEFEVTWAWTSSPITISQSPVAPLISFDGLTATFMGGSGQCVMEHGFTTKGLEIAGFFSRRTLGL